MADVYRFTSKTTKQSIQVLGLDSVRAILDEFQLDIDNKWTLAKIDPKTGAEILPISLLLPHDRLPAQELPNKRPGRPASLPPPPRAGSDPRPIKLSISEKLRVILTDDEKVLRVLCSEISMLGLKLDQPLPKEWWNKKLRIVIGNQRFSETIMLEADVFMDGPHPRRMRFVSPKDHALKALKRWLNASTVNQTA